MRQNVISKFTVLSSAILLLLLASCANLVYVSSGKKVTKSDKTVSSKAAKNANPELDLIKKAEKNASKEGSAILETGRKMALEEKVIIKGSCWNWVNEVFRRASYGTDKHIAYKSKKSGPYVDQNKIQPGDWIYYVNHSYGGVEHSGIFVYWKDYKKKTGVTLSYGGEHRKEPGRYLSYDLKDVYYITRAGKK